MRILIATATAGGGHLQAAAALEEAWKIFRPVDEIRRVDILDYTPRLYRKAYAEGYVRLADKTPELYAHAFRKSDNPGLVRKLTAFRRLAARLVARRFVRLVKDFQPHVVLSPHFLPIETLGGIKAKKLHRVPFVVCVVTDFEAHALWMEPCVDLYCVAAEETKARLVARGIPARSVVVTGIPVSQRFLKRIDAKIVRKRYGLAAGRPTLLVLAGGMGMGPLGETLAHLDRMRSGAQMVVVAGRNEKLRRQLSRRRLRHPAQVLGFVSNMEELMSVSDLIITKPGGLTSSEALAIGRPLLIVNPLPGQEAANSDFLLERGAASKVNRLEDLPFRADSLLRSARLASMSKAAKELGRPQAAMAICQSVWRSLGRGTHA
jgi:processive 1,2-diacylglycerol beta-glucosyltransferase